MKKMSVILAAVAALALSSCTTISPVCATGNAMGSKVGESSTILVGMFAFGNDGDMSIKTAAKNGGITKISTVDQKKAIGLFGVEVTTIVTGE